MAFPESVLKEAWKRAGGRCECTRAAHNHAGGRCNKELVWENRAKDGLGKWEAHRVRTYDRDVITNCEVLCWTCHKPAG